MDKVFCKNCKWVFNGEIQVWCNHPISKETFIQENWYERRAVPQESGWIPQYKNKNNDCKGYEERKSL